MALIKCPECGTEVSDLAESCPKCAYPIAGGGTSQAHSGKIQTIEKTGKFLKLQLLISALLFILGFIVMSAKINGGSQWAALFVVIGLIWHIMVRFKIWWHHG